MRDEFAVHTSKEIILETDIYTIPGMLNGIGLAKAKELGEIFSEALNRIEYFVPAGRERALVITKLQEASFFAKRGIALDPANQKDD